jgi:hypothetical protein
VVPVPFNMPRDELGLLFTRINGLVFQVARWRRGHLPARSPSPLGHIENLIYDVDRSAGT